MNTLMSLRSFSHGLKSASLSALLLLGATQTQADERSRDMAPAAPLPALTAAWHLLDCGERYKQLWFADEEIRGEGKTYKELLDSYVQAPAGGDCVETVDDPHDGTRPMVHQEYLDKAAEAFAAIIDSGVTEPYLEAAQWGLQESFNFAAEGRLVQGNDHLINGLRSRFKTDDPNSKSQIELLNMAATEMFQGLSNGTQLFVKHNHSLRQNGDTNPTFPFLVNNTEGPVTVNDYMQYTELVNRYGMAAISEAKFMFYRNNVKDVDNPPYRNFPGQEDLDLNGDRVLNEAGRIEAAKRAKKASSHMYLQSAALAAIQTEGAFQDNNGYQLKRQLNDADRLYQDILSGFNPLLLAGDFVPYQRVENFLQLARARVTDAAAAEALARSSERTYEVDETALATELRNQTTQYRDGIAALTGLPVGEHDLTTKDGRHVYRAEATKKIATGTGEIGVQFQVLNEELYQQVILMRQMNNLSAKMTIENQRSQEVMTLVTKNGEKISLLEFNNVMSSCCNVTLTDTVSTTRSTTNTNTQTSTTGSGSSVQGGFSLNLATKEPSVGVHTTVNTNSGLSDSESTANSDTVSRTSSETHSRNPDIEKLAKGREAMVLLQNIQQGQIDGVNSKAAIRNLVLEMGMVNLSLEKSRISIERQKAVINNLYDHLDRLMANYAVAQEDFAKAYFSNPAYRMQASRAEQAAEDTFETALELSYYAAKALEYYWSEKYNNPVLRLDGGLPEPLAVSFDPFMRAESVFTAQFASLFSPSLDDYLDALNAWDVKMRQLRYPERQTAKVRFSLRDDLLGFSEFSDSVAEAKFRAFIDNNRLVGENPDNDDLQFEFNMDIADERLFPNHPNIKIASLKVNLVSTASRSIRASSRVSPALVDLVMLDRAFVRTFFSEYPHRDDILTYQLQQGRTVDKSPFIATIDATIDGYASPQPSPNTQLNNHSPAVSTWVLRMRNNRYNNTDLKLEYLSDIELEVEYSFGKPRDIQFYN